MTSFSRFVIAAALVAGYSGLAQAQTHSRPSKVMPDRFYALSEGNNEVVDRTLAPSGAVPPSESHTVMGLRVPR